MSENKEFDVIIIGTGPGGLHTAAQLADTDLNVAVLSKFPNFEGRFDVKGTLYEMMVEFNLADCVITKQSNFGMYTKNEHEVFKYDHSRACVIDFYKMLNTLKQRSKATFIACEVLKIERNADFVSVIDNDGNEYKSKLLIDASGTSFVSLPAAGIEKPHAFYQCVSMILENCNIPTEKLNEMSLYMDKEVCNSSTWFYPIDEKRCQIGIGEMAPYTIASKSELHKNLMQMWNIYAYKDMLKGATVNEETVVYCQNPVIQPIEKMQVDRIMIIGDAAGMATPLVGDGVRPAMYGGYDAAVVTKEAFLKNDFSEHFLKKHEDLWWNRLGKYYIWTMIMRHFVCLYFDASDWDQVVRNLRKLDKEEFAEIIQSRMTLEHCLKVMDFKLSKDVLKGILERNIEHIYALSRRHLTSELI